MNLWLGLARGDRSLPRDLYVLGYRDRAIERAFPNSEMDQVCPEIIIASSKRHHALVLEFKSGANTESDQLRRYSGIISSDLTRAFLEPDECRSHDVVVVGRELHEERLRIGIEDGEHMFPLLLEDRRGLRLSLNSFGDEPTDAVLNPRLDIDWETAPTSYFPFDQESESWEIAEAVVPEVLARMLKREPRIEFSQICQALTPWGIISPDGRKQLLARTSEVLKIAAAGEFHSYWFCDEGGVRFKSNPLELGADRRTSAYRRLQNAQETLVDRLRTGGGPQLPLDWHS